MIRCLNRSLDEGLGLKPEAWRVKEGKLARIPNPDPFSRSVPASSHISKQWHVGQRYGADPAAKTGLSQIVPQGIVEKCFKTFSRSGRCPFAHWCPVHGIPCLSPQLWPPQGPPCRILKGFPEEAPPFRLPACTR